MNKNSTTIVFETQFTDFYIHLLVLDHCCRIVVSIQCAHYPAPAVKQQPYLRRLQNRPFDNPVCLPEQNQTLGLKPCSSSPHVALNP